MSKKKREEENISEKEHLRGQVEDILDEAIDEGGEQENQGKDEQNSEKEQLKAGLEKERYKFLRLFAEFENYKRRTSKERVELFKTASQDVITSMLPVLDDFDRALNEITKAKDKNLLKGVELIHNKFKETLRSKGLEVMKVREGDNFDPEMHEA